MPQPIVRPRDCALAVAIPADRRTFLDGLHTGGVRDFAVQYARSQEGGYADEEDLWRMYARTARLIRRVCRGARCQGVAVRRDATLADFAALASRFPVVTLVAHCHFPPIVAGDILDPAAFQSALRSPSGRVQVALREEVFRRDPGLLDPDVPARGDAGWLAAAVARPLGEIVQLAHAWYERPPTQGPDPALSGGAAGVDAIPAVRLTRPAVEDAFPGVIAPGRAVEFRDGLKTVGEVAAAIPTGFLGTLDLTLCTSAILGVALRRRLDGFPIVVNQARAEIDAKLLRYRFLIEELGRRPAPFADAIGRVHNALSRGPEHDQIEANPGGVQR